jgi:uncharacterized membrane protein YciS (DUF1049 family)
MIGWILTSVVYLVIALSVGRLLRRTKTFEKPLLLITASAISPIILTLAVIIAVSVAVIIATVTIIGRILFFTITSMISCIFWFTNLIKRMKEDKN